MDKFLYIFKLGKTFSSTAKTHKDFDDWVKTAILSNIKVDQSPKIQIIDILNGAKLPKFASCAGVILTGSHDMVTERLDWSERTRQWIQDSVQHQIPLLGICYGHQLIADAFGGEVDFHPKGIEVGTQGIQLTTAAQHDPLFTSIPEHFVGHCTHSQYVAKLPHNAVILAGNPHDQHHSFRLFEHIWGLQFHPEFTPEIMQDYLSQQTAAIAKAGLDWQSLQQQIQPTPDSTQILSRFATLCLQSNAQ